MTVPRARPATPTGMPRMRGTEHSTIPAPLGMNAVSPLISMGPEDCVFTYNLMPSEYGLRTRLGNVEHANGFTGGDVKTIIPYAGSREDLSNDRLFACASDGIYDISASGVAAAPVFTWASALNEAGTGVYTHYTNDAGAHFLLLADEENGLHEYEEATDTWTASTGITGPDLTKITMVTAHKRRIWLVENDSTDAWYLPTGAKAGEATKFNFGAQFREGGELAGLWSWTVDGGDGVDDLLVALSRAGGLAVYRGDDPANPSTWSIVGVWYIGRIPVGHRVATEYGGQLYILSEHGLLNVGALLRGVGVTQAVDESSDKVSRLIRNRMEDNITIRGWEVRYVHSENVFVIVAPQVSSSQPATQFVRNLTTNGWGFWRDMDVFTGDMWQGNFYWADTNGSVWKNFGTLDGALLDGTPGTEINFSMLTSYNLAGTPGVLKKLSMIRPYFLSAGIPSFSVQARYDFNLDENDGSILFNPGTAAVWDTALWDTDRWAGGVDATKALRGVTGAGRFVGIALRGSTQQRMTLVAFDVTMEKGGFL